MFLHLSVILSTGGMSAPVHAGIHTIPRADTPSPREQTAAAAGGTHPTGMHSYIEHSVRSHILSLKVHWHVTSALRFLFIFSDPFMKMQT